jgi:hypothetical protein
MSGDNFSLVVTVNFEIFERDIWDIEQRMGIGNITPREVLEVVFEHYNQRARENSRDIEYFPQEIYNWYNYFDSEIEALSFHGYKTRGEAEEDLIHFLSARVNGRDVIVTIEHY